MFIIINLFSYIFQSVCSPFLLLCKTLCGSYIVSGNFNYICLPEFLVLKIFMVLYLLSTWQFICKFWYKINFLCFHVISSKILFFSSSTSEYCKWLAKHPQWERPKYLVEIGKFDNKIGKF